MSTFLLLLLGLAAQDQTAEAKKLLDALAPPLKDPSYSQIEWECGATKGVGYFDRGHAWRLDQTLLNGGGRITVWDGKAMVQHMMPTNRFLKDSKEPQFMLLMFAGGLAEIHYSGNADRLLKDARTAVKKEKLEGVECSHVTVIRKDGGGNDVEHHFWIDSDKACKRYERRTKAQGKTYDTAYTYKVVDPPTTTEAMFQFKPPADAKDLRDR